LSSIRILVADDYEGWRRKISQLLEVHPEWQVICDVSDGLEVVQKAEELRPDLILLDIGLPGLNGIEAARRIRQLSPNSRIVFLSANNSQDVVQVALSTGAQGYVYKARSRSDLLPAIEAVLRGKQFATTMLRGYRFTDTQEKKPLTAMRFNSILMMRFFSTGGNSIDQLNRPCGSAQLDLQ
jgi:DNA-binding NarL/FixJ family response regulator